MSADEVHGHDAHGDDGHDEQHGLHATFGGYAIGFVLSVVLTAIPFWIVMTRAIESRGFTIFAILAFAAVQIVVQMVYFLHMTPKAEGGWSMMALAFTIILVVITLSGSLWVMFHLKSNMMPVTAEQMRKAP
jgi:cytochrome o ubiquinol oxidase operon protein cyoD